MLASVSRALMVSAVVFCSCGQCAEEDDHHRGHPVLPLAGSGGAARRKWPAPSPSTPHDSAEVCVCTALCSAEGCCSSPRCCLFCVWCLTGCFGQIWPLACSCPLQVLSCHIPFLVSSVEDFKDHIPRETDMKVDDLLLIAEAEAARHGPKAVSRSQFCVFHLEPQVDVDPAKLKRPITSQPWISTHFNSPVKVPKLSFQTVYIYTKFEPTPRFNKQCAAFSKFYCKKWWESLVSNLYSLY